MPSFNSSGKLYEAAASDLVVPKYITMQLDMELLLWLRCVWKVSLAVGTDGSRSSL